MVSLNFPQIVELYSAQKMTLNEVSEITGISKSTIRLRLIEKGVMRSFKESQILAGQKGRKGAHLIGKRNPMKEETKNKIRDKRNAWAENNATGVSIKPNGYVEITRGKNKGKAQHVVVMEERIGRNLLNDEVVHHIDGDRSNNDINNLALMTRSGHCRHHALENYLKRDRKENGQFK
jgi:hypothetical protein